MKTEFEIFLDEGDVTKVYKELQEILPSWRWDGISIGWCGWANAMNCWWIRVPLKRKEVTYLTTWISENGIRLLDPNTIE